MATSPSRSFDRAAEFYDRTRGLPDEVMARVTEVLMAGLGGRASCLEIGVGTGRIAMPLHHAGVAMTGIDLAMPMMAVLVDKAGGSPPFPLARADATVLPFTDDAFDAAVASHVFHLIPDWQVAVDELFRVVRPAGVVLVSAGAWNVRSVMGEVRRQFEREAGSEARHLGPHFESREVEIAFVERGAVERELPIVTATQTRTIGAFIDQLGAGMWSSTWSLPDDVVQDAAARTRLWALEEYGPLDAPHEVEHRVVWRAFDLP